MHIPDGFINAPVSAAGAVVATGAVAVAVRKASADLDERAVPLAGLTSAYIFAMQMLNFPVASGTSGHLIGACLAAVLVGPWLGVLVLTVVLGVQALLFADGGLSALGLNILVMGVVPVLVATGVVRGLQRVLPRGASSLVAATAIAAWCTVVAAAVVFTGYFALGGTADIALGDLAVAMVGVHSLIGIGEAVLTALTVSAVLASRPDLVWAARGWPSNVAAASQPAAVAAGGRP